MNRRDFLQTSGAAIAAGLTATPVLSELQLGEATLTTVSDGNLVLPGSMIFGDMPPNDLQPILDAAGVSADQLTPECNLALYRDGTNTVIFDAGAGFDFMPTAGKLADNLISAGVDPLDVTHVVFTHAHPDHIWGVLDDFDDPLFYNATHLIARAERDYWLDPSTIDTIGEARQSFAAGASRRLNAIKDQLEVFDFETEVLPGIYAIATPGHTPGHTGFEVRSGGADPVLIVGDAIGNHHVAFAKPGWRSGSDQDPDQAAQTRLSLLDRVTSDNAQIIGFHLPNGGIGRVESMGSDEYRFSV